MNLINPNGEYPRHYGDLLLDYPEWELGQQLPEGWVEVKQVEPPALTEGETYEEAEPLEIDGEWKQQWIKRDLTAEELAKIAEYKIRDKVAHGEYLTAEEASALVI